MKAYLELDNKQVEEKETLKYLNKALNEYDRLVENGEIQKNSFTYEMVLENARLKGQLKEVKKTLGKEVAKNIQSLHPQEIDNKQVEEKICLATLVIGQIEDLSLKLQECEISKDALIIRLEEIINVDYIQNEKDLLTKFAQMQREIERLTKRTLSNTNQELQEIIWKLEKLPSSDLLTEIVVELTKFNDNLDWRKAFPTMDKIANDNQKYKQLLDEIEKVYDRAIKVYPYKGEIRYKFINDEIDKILKQLKSIGGK